MANPQSSTMKLGTTCAVLLQRNASAHHAPWLPFPARTSVNQKGCPQVRGAYSIPGALGQVFSRNRGWTPLLTEIQLLPVGMDVEANRFPMLCPPPKRTSH